MLWGTTAPYWQESQCLDLFLQLYVQLEEILSKFNWKSFFFSKQFSAIQLNINNCNMCKHRALHFLHHIHKCCAIMYVNMEAV